jgi:DNA-binding beta-propeller fold protein YncE
MRKAPVMLMVLAALIGTQIVAANAAVVTFRQLFGGSNPDFARGIFVDSNYIYVVGETNSFGPNPPNLFLSIFRLDNSHKCSVAVDLGVFERGWKVVAYGGNVYVSGDTNYGGNPNVLVVKFDTNCNVLGAAVYDIDATNPDLPFGLSISSDGSTLYIAGFSTNGAHLLAVRTSDFSVAWAKLFKVTGAGDAANSVTFSGNKLYVTGRTSTNDLFVSRFDAASGNHEASKVFSTPQFEEGRDVVVAGGKVYVAGNYDDPVKQAEFLFMKLDTNLNLELAKTFGTDYFDAVTSLSMVGGLAYAVGMSNFFGSQDAALFAVDPSTGDLSHAFVLAKEAPSVQIAQDSASTGSCLIYTGFSDNWPAFYGVLDTVTAGTISFTISSPTPSIATPSVTPAFPTPTATGFAPTFNTPAAGDAFYSWFCPDALVVSTTTTSTVLTTSTLSTTVTSVVGSTTTVYDVRTTTITQTSITTTTSSTTTTLTQTATTTLTQSTTYSTTTTLLTTLTHSTTTTLSTTTTSTQYFAEPVTTYVLPALLAVIAALLGASLVVGRRRRALPY